MSRNNDSKTNKMSAHTFDENTINLAIARMRVLPNEFKIFVGDEGSFTKEEAIQNIIDGTDIGRELINAQIDFLKDMARGELYEFE